MIFNHRVAGIMFGLVAALAAGTAHAGSKPAGSTKGVAVLAAHHWDLVAWSGRDLPAGKPLRLDFDATKRVFSSDTGCNRAFGAYQAKGKSLRFGRRKAEIASTMMACPRLANGRP